METYLKMLYLILELHPPGPERDSLVTQFFDLLIAYGKLEGIKASLGSLSK